MSRTRIIVVTAGVMMSLFLASMESTVIATAMPTIVSQLGGIDSYSWVFTAFMLTSTTVVPVFGKLADIYGIRPVYLVAIVLFLGGSLLCGMAGSMTELIIYRAIQGIGAGGLLPLSFITIGAIFSFEQRARMQGFFSSVWGVSAVAGPLLGGFLVDTISWRWVFYVNIVPGLIAAALVGFALVERKRESATRPAIDFAGVVLLSIGCILLLLGLSDVRAAQNWAALIGAAICFGILSWVERRAADPIVPLRLFQARSFAVACGHGVLAGFAVFGCVTFIPLYAQAVLGTTATGAGATLIPLMLGWVFASIVGSRLLLRISYRSLAMFGMVLLTIGAALLLLPTISGLGMIQLLIPTAFMGVGMGLSIPAFLITVQSSVARNDLGAATSTVQFSRSIGGTFGVSVMGAVLAAGLAASLTAAGVDPSTVSLNGLIDPLKKSTASTLDGTLQLALGSAMHWVFLIALVASIGALIVTTLAPRGTVRSIQAAQPTPTISAE
ncbi:MAG: MDR family MFS transporter [Roseiflexaceae bacterium]|nr:MDR family MFS transporter [Roseiflexaceae bacterium]